MKIRWRETNCSASVSEHQVLLSPTRLQDQHKPGLDCYRQAEWPGELAASTGYSYKHRRQAPQRLSRKWPIMKRILSEVLRRRNGVERRKGRQFLGQQGLPILATFALLRRTLRGRSGPANGQADFSAQADYRPLQRRGCCLVAGRGISRLLLAARGSELEPGPVQHLCRSVCHIGDKMQQ